MQPPPPPTGCTGKAPPGAGAGEGITADEAVDGAGAGVPPGEKPAAKASATTPTLKAAVVLEFGLFTSCNGSCSSVDAQVKRPVLGALQGPFEALPRE